jgi:putative nucleotidyltransferase with HDIG domain
MQDELLLEASGLATTRLRNGTWSTYLQSASEQFKEIGIRYRAEGSKFLTQRLERMRPTTYAHCVRVARLTNAMGRVLNFNEAQLKELGRAAMMHDIGKIFVPNNILNRPRKPNPIEQFVLRLHPTFGAILVSYFAFPAALRTRTHYHHERWDGKGYPHKLSGENIPQMARIVQVADTIRCDDGRTDLTAHRQRTMRQSPKSGTQFDPRMVEAFLDALSSQDMED